MKELELTEEYLLFKDALGQITAKIDRHAGLAIYAKARALYQRSPVRASDYIAGVVDGLVYTLQNGAPEIVMEL